MNLYRVIVDYLFFRDVNAIVKPMDKIRERLIRHSAKMHASANEMDNKAEKLHNVSAVRRNESSRAVGIANKLQEFFEL